MKAPLIAILAIAALAFLYVLVPTLLYAYQRFRKKRVVRCPETGGLAEVDIDAPRAALSSIFGDRFVRAKNCTLWPSRRGCKEGCLKQ